MRADSDLRIPSSTPLAPPPEPRRRSSPLTRRILAVNLVAPALLVLGLLFLDEYEQSLVDAEFEALKTQGELIAASIGEGAVVVDTSAADFPLFTAQGAARVMEPSSARQIVRRLAALAGVRAQLFSPDGLMIADSRLLGGPGGSVQVKDLPPMSGNPIWVWITSRYEQVITWLNLTRELPVLVESTSPRASDFPEAAIALERGESDEALRRSQDGALVLTVALPVQFYKQIVGVVVVSTSGQNIDRSLFEIRASILEIFAWTFAVTVLLSIYMAGTVARPIRQLAEAAVRVRRGKTRQHKLPDLSARKDEIGELSAALTDMTETLWLRMDAIEGFAADVAHEIKNPLTSLRSAVETVSRVEDTEQQKKLMSIIQDDVARLDRLISDISDASRLDAELSRAEREDVSLLKLLNALAEVNNASDDEAAPRVELDADEEDTLTVPGLEVRLGQVFRNLIGNAVSFSPPHGSIKLKARRDGLYVKVDVEDEGPGIPEGKEDAIFTRFYSERPEKEKFGTHSGLGLSISRQIIEAHGGQIWAENRGAGRAIIADGPALDIPDAPASTETGARFSVLLPIR